MPATYEPISSTTLGSTSASVTLSDIPGTFTDLVLVCWGDTTQTNDTTSSLGLRFNGDTASNYSNTGLFGNGSSATSGRNSSTAEAYVGDIAGSINYNTPLILYIFSYANTNVNKTVLGMTANPGWGVVRTVALWRSTSAITSLSLRRFSATADLSSDSRFDLYGIKAA